MKKLSLLALLFALSACTSDKLEGEAIKATVVLDPAVKASCIHVEVRDPATHVAAGEDWVARQGKNELQVAIIRKSLPKDVEIAAQPYQDGDCANHTPARTVNGAVVTVPASFVEGQIVPVTLPKMLPGTDTDNDGYVSTDTGGADCQDGAGGGGVNPSAQEQCTDQQDLNCDNKPGCAASACGQNACFGQPANMALSLPTTVTAGTCMQGTLQLKDSSGKDSRATTAIPVTLASNPNGSIAFYSDSDCKTPAQSSAVTITQGEAGATFFFQGQTVGTVTVSASATALPTASQTLQINPGAGNQLIFLSLAQQVTAGACSGAVQIQSQDAQGNPSPVATATPITLTATPNTSFQFFSSSTCATGTELASVTMAATSSTATFYFKGTKAGGVRIAATASGFTGNTQDETIKPAAAKNVILTGPTTATAGDCTLTKVDVTLQDMYSNPVTAAANTTINLSVSTGKALTFSASSGCATTTSSVVIGMGQATVSFFFKGTLVGASTINAAATGLTAGTLNVTMNAAAPSTHVFTTTAQTVQAGNCSSVVTVQMQDGFANPAPVTSDTIVSLSASPPDGFQFFAGPGCSGSAVTQVTIPTGMSDVNFSFRPTRTPAVIVTAAVSATNKTQNETINPAAPASLVLSPSSVPMQAGECKQVTVQAQDSFGNNSPVSGNQTVTLSGNPSTNFGFYSNSGCTTSIGTSVTINSGQSNAGFYVKGTTPGTVTVTASHSGWTDGTATVTVSPAVPNKIVFKTAAQHPVVGACSSVTTLEVQDAFGNPTTGGADRTINLTPASVTFYPGSGCTASAATSVVVLAGQTTVDFSFKASAAGSVTITAADGTLTQGTQTETIDPLPPDALAFTTTEKTATAGVCTGPVTVQTRAGGNATTVTAPLQVTPSGTGFTFFSDNNCNNAAATVTINTSASTTDFYFKGSTAGTFVLTAHSGTLTDATQNATINAAAPTKLAYATPPLTTVAGVCSLAVTIQSQDPFDNPAPVTSNKTLALNQTGTPADSNFKFYSDSNCTNDTGTSLLLPSGQSSASFYYRGEKARTVTFAISTAGLTGTPFQAHTIVPASLSKLAFSSTTPAQTLLAGTCAMRTIERQDQFGNIRADPVDLPVTLSGSTAAEFFQDSNCTTPLPPLSILSGSGSASFYFKGYTGGDNASAPLTLTVASSGLTSGPQTENINPTIRTGSCTLSGTTVNCPISLPVSDTTKTFLVFRATSTNNGSHQTNARCRLNTTSQIVCDRANNMGADVTVNWTLAEFPTRVTVQHLTPTCTSDTTSATASTVVPTESFVLLSSERNVNDQGSSVPRLVELKSATQAEIRKTTGGCTGDVTNLQVVDFAGASVQRSAVTSMASGATSATATLSNSVATDRSILLYSYRIANTGTKICDRAIRGELTNGTTVTFFRGEGDTTNCAGMAIPEISWEVIQFPPGTSVQQFTVPVTGGSAPISGISPVDLSRTMVFAGGQWASGQLHGEGKYSGSEEINEMRAQYTWVGNDTLQISRESSNSTAKFTVFVVQFKP